VQDATVDVILSSFFFLLKGWSSAAFTMIKSTHLLILKKLQGIVRNVILAFLYGAKKICLKKGRGYLVGESVGRLRCHDQ
jgi:hypothetical protein